MKTDIHRKRWAGLVGGALLLVVVAGVFVVISSRQVPELAALPETVSEASGGSEVFESLAVSTAVPESDREPVLSSAVQQLLSEGETYRMRAKLVDTLGNQLSADDVAALRDFLTTPVSDVEGLSPIALNAIKTDVLDVLIAQEVFPERLGQQVVDMFNDPGADYMWREYCLQFMEPLSVRLSKVEGPDVQGSGQESNRQSETVIRQCLLSALEERDDDLAGTALLGLSRMARNNNAVDREEVGSHAVEIAGDSGASVRCRLTALGVASQAGNEEVLPIARELAQYGETDLLRGAAITALGRFANPDDRELLQHIAATGNRQLNAAAKKALANLEETP